MDVDSNLETLDSRGPDPWQVLDSLLYSVSHDLRSPLLTMTLSTDLIDEGLNTGNASASSENIAIGLAALRQGATDLERMLETLTQLSRARRRELTPMHGTLQMVLSEYTTIVDGETRGETVVLADALAIREFIDIVAGDQPTEIVVRSHPTRIELSMAAPEELTSASSPLDLLVRSLQEFAGTRVQAMAVQQVILNRQNVGVRIQEGRLLIDLPVVGAA